MGKKTSVKLTHSTVYIPWVGKKKGFFWNDFSFRFSVPPPKRIGMYMKVGPDSTRRTCKRSLHNCIAQKTVLRSTCLHVAAS